MKRIILSLPFLLALIGTVLLTAGCDNRTHYRHYARNGHVKVSFARNYVIADDKEGTVTVDVTLLEAVDTAGWKTLVDDFGLNEPTGELAKLIAEGADIVGSKSITTDNKEGDDILAVSYKRHIVSIFHTRTKKEEMAILNHNTSKTARPKEEGFAFNVTDIKNSESDVPQRTFVDGDGLTGLMDYLDSIYSDTTFGVCIDDATVSMLHSTNGTLHFFVDDGEAAFEWCRRMYVGGYIVYIVPRGTQYHCVAECRK